MDGASGNTDLYKWIKTRRMKQRATEVATERPHLNTILFEMAAGLNSNYYLKSPHDYSIKVQLQTRGHALPTNLKKDTLFPGSERCGPCCETYGEIESEHHVFVTCPSHANEQNHCTVQLQNRLKN
jgi:hypothetical protein